VDLLNLVTSRWPPALERVRPPKSALDEIMDALK